MGWERSFDVALRRICRLQLPVFSVSEQESNLRSPDYPCAIRDLSKPASYMETRFTLYVDRMNGV